MDEGPEPPLDERDFEFLDHLVRMAIEIHFPRARPALATLDTFVWHVRSRDC